MRQSAFVKKIGLNRIILAGVLVLMVIVFRVFSPTFLSYARLLSILNYACFLGFLALAVTFAIATGGIDFSVGPVMFCAALISGQLLTKSDMPVLLCLIISVAVGTMFGILNGALVAYVGLPSFITSMASMMIAKGVGSVFTKTQSVSWPQSSDPKGWYRNLLRLRAGDMQIPLGLIILIAVAVLCAIILNKTHAGRYILCLGSNKEAVRLSGVNVRKWEMLAYVICGTLAGIAAIFYVSAYTTVQPGLGDTFNNEAIASCVMGGTSMAGGLASVGGTIFGTMIISVLQEGIMAMGFQKDYQYVLTGIIVLIAVYMDIRSRKRKN
ncbi:MAG: ABC transporter permease [Lachnospiraceae bacterium]|nr:ABC transporter permease [Lachnospiraceae bacterium]